MTPTPQQQLASNIEATEHEIESLRAQPFPNQQVLEMEERELRILKTKQSMTPQ